MSKDAVMQSQAIWAYVMVGKELTQKILLSVVRCGVVVELAEQQDLRFKLAVSNAHAPWQHRPCDRSCFQA
jgi:hypothetical protein